MAIVIKEIHVCTTIEKDRGFQQEAVPEIIEKMKQLIREEIERYRLGEIHKKER